MAYSIACLSGTLLLCGWVYKQRSGELRMRFFPGFVIVSRKTWEQMLHELAKCKTTCPLLTRLKEMEPKAQTEKGGGKFNANYTANSQT